MTSHSKGKQISNQPASRATSTLTRLLRTTAQLSSAQKIHSGSALTFLKDVAAHLSRTAFVGRHLFSSQLFAFMQFLNCFTSSLQNFSRMAWRGEPSSSLGKLKARARVTTRNHLNHQLPTVTLSQKNQSRGKGRPRRITREPKGV